MELVKTICAFALVVAAACYAEGLSCTLEGKNAGLWWTLQLALCAAAVIVAGVSM